MSRSPCPNCRKNGRDRSGDNLVEFRNGSRHCFVCGYHEDTNIFEKLKEYHEPLRAENSALLPDDATRVLPRNAVQWLLKYDLPPSCWEPNSLFYSENTERLYFLLGTPPEISWGRDLSGKGKLKWLSRGSNIHQKPLIFPATSQSPTNKSQTQIGSSTEELPLARQTQALPFTPIILVEDILSAKKISMAGFSSLPLFGVTIHPPVLNLLREWKTPVILWLDMDQLPTMAKKSSWINQMTGCRTYFVATRQDPKELPLETIRELIQGLDKTLEQ